MLETGKIFRQKKKNKKMYQAVKSVLLTIDLNIEAIVWSLWLSRFSLSSAMMLDVCKAYCLVFPLRPVFTFVM